MLLLCFSDELKPRRLCCAASFNDHSFGQMFSTFHELDDSPVREKKKKKSTISYFTESGKCGEWLTQHQMCSHLVSAWSFLSQPKHWFRRWWRGAQSSTVQQQGVGVTGATNIGVSLYPHNLPSAPLLPPACAASLPASTLGKIIRWLADILSIFLSWLTARLAGRALIDVLTEFLFSLPWFAKLQEGK